MTTVNKQYTSILMSLDFFQHPPCTDPFSVRPTSQAPPVASKPFSLRCVGPQGPASITWLKNKRQMLASERVNFSPDNTTVTFSPLLREDGGVYQCLVLESGNRTVYDNTLVEGETPVLSVGYLMQVNCEYTRVMKIIMHFAFKKVEIENVKKLQNLILQLNKQDILF